MNKSFLFTLSFELIFSIQLHFEVQDCFLSLKLAYRMNTGAFDYMNEHCLDLRNTPSLVSFKSEQLKSAMGFEQSKTDYIDSLSK